VDNLLEIFIFLPLFMTKTICLSTTENLCVYFWNELDRLFGQNGLLYEIKIYETDKNSFAYRGQNLTA
jgi:hypothetical protein